MDTFSREDRKRIFEHELTLLKEGEYISTDQSDAVSKAHQQYYSDLLLREKQLEKENLVQEKDLTKINEVIEEKAFPVKRKLLPEEIRERNITWSLNLGVLLLLIGGLFVATSNWETMENWMKSGLIALVSALFYAIAYVSNRFIKIQKTAFAFMVLGSLFLPIFILSLGWFELLGSYLSFYGKGRHVLGTLGALVLLPVYFLLARKMKSRLFVWFTFITATIGMGFFLASLNLHADAFYLGIMLFNALLIFEFHKLNKSDFFALFTKEFVVFSQVNLILSTLFMLLFYHQPLFYGFNLIVTAIIYLSMVYVTKKKEFHFVFTAMIVYGLYQVIEHSILVSFDAIFYAFAGMAFLAVPKFLDDKFPWEKVFQITSAVVSGLAFLFISFEGILLRMNEPSFVLMIAYLIIAGNFLYLANVNKNKLFNYLSPIFLLAAFYEAVLKLDFIFHFDTFILPVFFIGFLLFIIFGTFMKIPQLDVIKESSRDVGLAVMSLAIVVSIGIFYWLELGIMLLALSIIAYILLKIEQRKDFLEAAPWVLPLSLGFAFTAFGEELRLHLDYYQNNLGVSTNFVLGSMIVLVSCIIWKKLSQQDLVRNSFYVSQGLHTVAIISALSFHVNDLWVRPLILFAGIVMYFALFKKIGDRLLTYLVSLLSLIWYFSIIYALHLKITFTPLMNSLFFTAGAIFLFAVAVSLRKKESELAAGFAVTGHSYLPIALIISFILYREDSMWSFIAALVVYAVSTAAAGKEWKKKIFLYGAFTSLFFTISIWVDNHYDGNYEHVAYFMTSILIGMFWFIAKNEYKKRTVYFLIPFSLIVISAFITVYPYEWELFIATLFYAAFVLVFLHLAKWDQIAFLPILLAYFGTVQFLALTALESMFKVLILLGIGLFLLFTGSYFYKKLFEEKEGQKIIQYDSYTLTAFLFFCSAYYFSTDHAFVKLLPGLLISGALWLQRNRVPKDWAFLPAFLAGAYLLQPYYSAVDEFNVPDLWEREVIVLPWIAVVIYLRRCLQGKYKKYTNYAQWGVLFLVSILLVQDGLASSTVYDALILGSLSLISILAGMFFKIKSYFFVGSGVLLLNVLLQTRPYWGNLPWWAYLLIAGSILISAASYNEWHKQKKEKGERTLLTNMKEKIISTLKRWE
ncbi:hypothetical protein PB1_00370 [Bacillus methanolicus PB1]|uniref:DUF2157 domain-containing protein n=1 Tax=Bacillus methanolicus PB1 TaxID=997296 RepID=I3E4D2_BACMT|nr:hypothetical protein [Bacillus methanolicus]EIJ81353.1 hypothetical protein PB1_00370 [Bacillus methanolicus PB1]